MYRRHSSLERGLDAVKKKRNRGGGRPSSLSSLERTSVLLKGARESSLGVFFSQKEKWKNA